MSKSSDSVVEKIMADLEADMVSCIASRMARSIMPKYKKRLTPSDYDLVQNLLAREIRKALKLGYECDFIKEVVEEVAEIEVEKFILERGDQE